MHFPPRPETAEATESRRLDTTTLQDEEAAGLPWQGDRIVKLASRKEVHRVEKDAVYSMRMSSKIREALRRAAKKRRGGSIYVSKDGSNPVSVKEQAKKSEKAFDLPPLPSILTQPLGLEGWVSYEPVLLAALVPGEPLLLIGPHGSAKSFLLERLAKVLGLEYLFYNASLINYDDLVGVL